MTDWMIYGANGYTGELIAREARRRGLDPILAGRSREKIEALGRELELRTAVFSLDDSGAAARHLQTIAAVLHCAGPFVRTSEPMVRACLEAGAHYLDLTGEIAVFEFVMGKDSEARNRGVILLPGVGFDVVPSDCLAASLATRLPSAKQLILAFHTVGGSFSRGTLKTMIEGLGQGGAVRRGGKIIRVPTLFDVREIPFSCGARTAMAIPWGDVSTAYYTTGIPDITVFYATPRKAIRKMRLLSPIMPLLATRLVRDLLQKRAGRQKGPDAAARASGHVYLYGQATDGEGKSVSATMTTPEGYAFTVLSALEAVRRLFPEPARPGGAYTPAGLFGADFAESIPGVTMSALVASKTVH